RQHGDVASGEMRNDVIEAVSPEGTAMAGRLGLWRIHEMIDDELAPTGEEIAEALGAIRCLEAIILGDPHPGEIAPGLAQLFAQLGKILFHQQQALACLEPFLLRDDTVAPDGLTGHVSLP